MIFQGPFCRSLILIETVVVINACRAYMTGRFLFSMGLSHAEAAVGIFIFALCVVLGWYAIIESGEIALAKFLIIGFTVVGLAKSMFGG